jgi:CubicO group peptidase (beta-lactamase class C family)
VAVVQVTGLWVRWFHATGNAVSYRCGVRWRQISRSILAIGCVVILVGCSTPAPTVQDSKVLAPDAQDTRIAPSVAVLDRAVDPANPGCSAAVAVDGKVVWTGARGTANLAMGEKLTTETRFDIASLSKQFTATAILMLQREGQLSLSDPIGEYVDGLPKWGTSITLEQLMHHTSHIPDYWRKLAEWGIGFSTPATQADAIRAIAAVPTLDRGTGYLYSNSNYILLAEVVHKVSGEALPDFLAHRIFGPLNLKMELKPDLQAPDIAVSYDDSTQPTRSGWAFYGAVGIFTTPTQIVRWADQYRNGTFVANDFATGAVDSGNGKRYGAGISIESDGSLRHDGRLGGFVSTLKISPDRETAVAVMCNGHLANRFGVLDGLWAIWVDPPPGD